MLIIVLTCSNITLTLNFGFAEIYQTERNHVRTLKVLEGVFMNPLINSGYLPTELSTLLFPPALSSLKNLHNSFENNLKQRKIEHNSIVGDIGDLLLSMVS